MTAAPFLYDPEDPLTQADPYPAYRRLRDEFPVYRQPRLGFFALSRFDDVHDALADHATFSSAQGLTWDPAAAEQAGVLPMMVTTDPPAHTALRQLVNRGLTPRRVAALEPDVREIASAAVDALRRAGGGDVVAALAVPLPATVIGRFLGVPAADREQFHHWATAVVGGTSGAAYHEAHHRATRELYAYFATLVAAPPADGLVAALVATGLADRDVLGFCFNIVIGGIETTASLVANGLVTLDAHPDVPLSAGRIPATVDEFLRLETPVQGLCRTTTRSVELHGTTIPAGEKVLLLFGAANRDEREFPDPDRLDLDRAAERHLAFGYGAHYCIGAALARLMGRIAFEELGARLPHARVEPDEGRRLPSAVSRGWLSLPLVVA